MRGSTGSRHADGGPRQHSLHHSPQPPTADDAIVAPLHRWEHPTEAPEGVFAQRAHRAGTAPIIMLFIPGTSLKTTHLQKHA